MGCVYSLKGGVDDELSLGRGGFTTTKSLDFVEIFVVCILFLGGFVVCFEKQSPNTISQGICIVIFSLDVQLGRL